LLPLIVTPTPPAQSWATRSLNEPRRRREDRRPCPSRSTSNFPTRGADWRWRLWAQRCVTLPFLFVTWA